MDDPSASNHIISSVLWALERMIELRSQGKSARFRVVWIDRGGQREYRLEIRHEGRIERPVWPLPLMGGQTVEESPMESSG